MARYVKEIMRGAGRGSNRLSLVRKGNPSLFSPQRAACGWCLESNQKPAGKTRRPAVATIEDAQKRADNSRKDHTD